MTPFTPATGAVVSATTIAPFLFFLLHCSLLLGSARAFAVPAVRKGGIVEHRLLNHVDQLQQRDSAGALVPPPHLFCLPAPGGNVCLAVDEKGGYHAVRDAFPPLGLPISESGVVDTQVNAIGDTLFGTRFHLSDGTVRGPWCPGGTAGPLLRLARRLPRGRLLREWVPLRRRLRQREEDRPRQVMGTALEVLPVTEHPDGSLTVTIPSLLSAPRSDASDESKDAGACDVKTGGVVSTKLWVEGCGLAGVIISASQTVHMNDFDDIMAPVGDHLSPRGREIVEWYVHKQQPSRRCAWIGMAVVYSISSSPKSGQVIIAPGQGGIQLPVVNMQNTGFAVW